MLPQNNISKSKATNSAKKDFSKNSPSVERTVSFAPQNFSPSSEQIIVTVIPCGREDGKNSEDEMPYEMKIRKKVNEHSLKEVFTRKPQFWEKIFKQHLDHEATPNFSIYRKPFEYEQDPSKSDLFLHILYMKSQEKALTRNYNAQELELFCHNRFYGPLVVAYNLNKSPYYLCNFTLSDLQNIEMINRNFQNKSIKDDYVPDCLLDFKPLRQDLDTIYKDGGMEVFTFYMFKYKSSWCPNKKDSHDSKSCIYAHHTRDFRRPPEIFKYLPEDCETLVKGIGWDKCEKGLKCNKCHTTVERLYHPDKYKRIFCDRSRCNKSEICAFYHSTKERQQANKECKNYRKSIDQRNIPDFNDLQEKLAEYYRNQMQAQAQAQTSKSSLCQEMKEQSLRDSSSSSTKSHTYDEFKVTSFDASEIYQIQISPPHNHEANKMCINPKMASVSTLDKSSPLFQPSYRTSLSQPLTQMPQHQPQQPYFIPNNNMQQPMTQMTQSHQMMPIQPIQQKPQHQMTNMQQIQLIQSNPTHSNNGMSHSEEKPSLMQQKEQFKMQMNYFDYYEQEDMKTRNSTFSKASEGREEIKKNCVSFYEKAFIQEQPMCFLNPVDDEDQSSPYALNRQPSGKSPSNFASPIILDFLEDDNFFQVEEIQRMKSKTEFVKRERQESEDSNQDEYQLPGDAQEYLNSILPNNSIKFKKHSQSVRFQ